MTISRRMAAIIVGLALAGQVFPSSASALDEISAGLDGRVTQVLAPADGGLLVGTTKGAFALEGVAFVPVARCDRDATVGSSVVSLIEDPASGRLWIAALSSMHTRLPGDPCWANVALPADDSLVIDSAFLVNDTIAVETEAHGNFGMPAAVTSVDAIVVSDLGLVLDERTRFVDSIDDELIGIASSTAGEVVVVMRNGAYDISTGPCVDLDACELPIAEQLWAAGSTADAILLSTSDETYRYMAGQLVRLVEHVGLVPTAVTVDKDGNTWLAAAGGVFRSDVQNWTLVDETARFETLGPPALIARDQVTDSAGVEWAATNQGLWQRAPGQEWASALSQDVSAVWLDGDDNVWFGTTGAGVGRIDTSGDVVVEGSLSSVTAGVFVDGQTFVVSRAAGGTEGIYEIVDGDSFGRRQVAEVDGAQVLAPNRGVDPTGLWVGGSRGLHLVSLSRPNVVSAFDQDTDVVKGAAVTGLELLADGSLRTVTNAGAFSHVDRGNPPLVHRVEVREDDNMCADCFTDELDWSATSVRLTAIGTDTADIEGLCAEFVVMRPGPSDPEPLAFDPDDCSSATLRDLEPGESYAVHATMLDRHFNRSERFDAGTIAVGTKSAGERLRDAALNPFVWVGGGFLLAACWVGFTAWRWRGKQRIRDASMTIGLVDGRPTSTLKIGWSSHVFESPSRLVAEDFLFDEDKMTEGVIAGTGRSLLRTFAGDKGQARLGRAVSNPFTKRLRLRIGAASEFGMADLDWLPWEALGDSDGLLVERGLAPMRQVRSVSPRTVQSELRILVARSAPKSEEDLEMQHFEAQCTAISAAFPQAEVVIEDNLSIEGLSDRLTEPGFDIIHLYAHGQTDAQGGHLIMPTDEDDGMAIPIYWGDLWPNKPKNPALLVTLAACRTSGSDTTQGLAQLLVREGLADCAIGFAYEVGQEALADFSTGMYAALGASRQVDIAVAAGRGAIKNAKDRLSVRHYGGPDDAMLYHRR